jgi:hypothetical protein
MGIIKLCATQGRVKKREGGFMKHTEPVQTLSAPFEQKQTRIPQRMCIACRVRKDKKGLLRLVKADEGSWMLDVKKNIQKRGIYLCPTIECKQKAKKNKQYSTIEL